MARILITSGPTRQYLDPVRYLSNASSGRMGSALAQAALDAGHQVIIVSGPVQIAYPDGVKIVPVVTTEDMLSACFDLFPTCDGLIAVAAPCDYRPKSVSSQKLRKTDETLRLELVETPDIVASLATVKTSQWMVAFALETEDHHMRAMQKLERKKCDLIVVNGPATLNSSDMNAEMLGKDGQTLGSFSGPKTEVAKVLFAIIENQLINAK